MRVLGIDCGSACTGYGVVDSDGSRHRMVSAGVIKTDPRTPFERRLSEIAVGLRDLIPDQSVIADPCVPCHARVGGQRRLGEAGHDRDLAAQMLARGLPSP